LLLALDEAAHEGRIAGLVGSNGVNAGRKQRAEKREAGGASSRDQSVSRALHGFLPLSRYGGRPFGLDLDDQSS
jgi:hypothetical protein